MCKGCWLKHGAPTELPANADEIVEAIEALYEQPRCGVGGPLHVELDDLNLDLDGHIWEPWSPDYDPYPPETIAVAQKVCDLMNSLPVDQRYAVAAKWRGWI